MSVNSKMTAIADEIRELSGTTGAMVLDAMASNLSKANAEVVDQADLLAQVLVALDGKDVGGSGGGAVFEYGQFTVAYNGMYEPGVNEYIFSSPNLKGTSRNGIIVKYGVEGIVLIRNGDLWDKYGLITGVSVAVTADTIITNDEINLYGSIGSDKMNSFSFVAF